MNRVKSIVIVLALFITFGLVIGCAPALIKPDVPVNPIVMSKVAYAEALQTYYNSATSYKMWFEAAPPEVQEKWREDFHPLFKKAKLALDMWKMFLDEGELPDNATINDWKRIKTQLLIKLYEQGIAKPD